MIEIAELRWRLREARCVFALELIDAWRPDEGMKRASPLLELQAQHGKNDGKRQGFFERHVINAAGCRAVIGDGAHTIAADT
ncbi:hypothetical protein [Burkholderia sp. Ac-20365]|uniref:hypothetical protein n=1 Tax=Burkholderia sp. Ac-20365 TaxID=2703897 RepID=UPI00197C0944|nr:hypothetical protein [Burkholderia sp. Ac-20365]MBN3759644.1 hypothetical protein [Burkholderia sp. Ac-20365]